MTDKATTLAHLARALAGRDRELPLPLRLCQSCAEILDADGAAITLAYTLPQRVTLCATDDVMARLEDLQEVLGQGPGPQAYATGKAVIARLDGPDESGSWAMFAQAASDSLGFAGAIYSLPIRPEAEVLGVLTLYQSTPRPLDRGIDAAQFLADALGAALLRDPQSHSELSPGPWASRAAVHQATGMVVAQLRISPADALALLRAHAFAHDTSLDLIAAQVVRRELNFSAVDSDRNERS